MKKLLLVLFILCFAGFASAAPFLVCDDPGEELDSYTLVLNDGSEISTPAPLHYNLESLEPGQYVVTAKAVKGVWKSEPSDPLDFTKPSLLQPILSLSTE